MSQSIFSAYCVLDVRTCQNWFARFRSGNFDLNDQDRSMRPAEPDSRKEDLWNLLQSLQNNRLKALRKILKAEKWIPHKLSEINMENCKETRGQISQKRLGKQKRTSPSSFIGPCSLRLSFVPVDATLPRRERFFKEFNKKEVAS